MPLIKMNHKYLIGLRKLSRLVLRYIYDNDSVTRKETDNMMRGIMAWDQNRFKTEEQEIWLQKLGKLLKDDGEGKLEKRKKLFRDKGIDYRKFHRLREAYKPGEVKC